MMTVKTMGVTTTGIGTEVNLKDEGIGTTTGTGTTGRAGATEETIATETTAVTDTTSAKIGETTGMVMEAKTAGVTDASPPTGGGITQD